MINRILSLFILMVLTGCMNRKQDYAESEDGVLLVKGVRDNSEEGESFKVRLLLKQGVKKQLEEQIYNMDSCFYLISSGNKIYPLGVTPVSSGVANGYEYLIYFDKISQDFSTDLIYHDKFISKKEYKLSFK